MKLNNGNLFLIIKTTYKNMLSCKKRRWPQYPVVMANFQKRKNNKSSLSQATQYKFWHSVVSGTCTYN